MIRTAHLVGLFLVVAALAGAAAPAIGHGQFLSSTPAPSAILPTAPTHVTVTLSEEVDPATASIRVTNSTGARVDANETAVLPSDARVLSRDLAALGPGVYTVAWSATSAVDGHFSAGSLAFGVQNPDGTSPGPLPGVQTTAEQPVSPVEVAIRAGTFFAMTACAGALALAALAWQPAARNLTGSQAAAAADGMRRLLFWAGGNAAGMAAFASAWAAYSLFAAVQSGALANATSSAFFISLEAKVGLAAAAAVVTFALWWRSRLPGGAPSRMHILVALALALGAVLTTSIASHSAAALQWQPIGALADGAHLVGVSVWVGGVLALVISRNHLRAVGSQELTRGVLERFAKMAFVCVGLVLLAGLLLSLIQIGSIDRVTATAYGYVVLAKVGLFAPMVALGAHNHFKSVPLLKDAKRAAQALERVVKNVRVEAALGACVLVLAGLLTTLVPGAAVAPPDQPYLLEQSKDGVKVQLQFYPAPGPPNIIYTLSVEVSNATPGGSVPKATNATLRFTLLNSTLPPSEAVLQGPHDFGTALHFFADTPDFAQPGTWRVDVAVVRSDSFDVRVTFYVTIRGA